MRLSKRRSALAARTMADDKSMSTSVLSLQSLSPGADIESYVPVEAFRQGLFLLRREDGEGAYGLHIALNVRPWGEAL